MNSDMWDPHVGLTAYVDQVHGRSGLRLGLRWRVRGDVAPRGSEVALRGTDVAMPRRHGEGWRSGAHGAGERRPGEVRRGCQKQEGNAGNRGRMFWSPEDAAMAGGEVMSGGADRFNGGDAFRWSSGETEASTGCARRWRCRWWRRRGRDDGDGGARGGRVGGGCRRCFANSGETRARGREWVVGAG